MGRLYDPDNHVKWRDLSLEELLKLTDVKVNYHLRRAHRGQWTWPGGSPPAEGKTSIPGLLIEDLRQELVFVIWKKIYSNNKMPEDLVNFDYRFIQFVDVTLRRALIDLYRARTFPDKNDTEPHPKNHGQTRPKRKFRDELNYAVTLSEDNDEAEELFQQHI